MLRPHRSAFLCTAALVATLLLAASATAQERPWVLYPDSVKNVCGVIHGANAEFVVLQGSGVFVKVSGTDVTLTDLAADGSRNVFFGSEPSGFIGFDVDGDGDRALFWTTLTGRLVQIDPFDATPSESNLTPRDIRNTGCDACSQWDNPAACEDPDDGGSGDGGDGGGSPLAGLCGSGSGTAAAASMALMLVHRGRRSMPGRPRQG